MTYTLYGSKTSPFVRRIRMLMENIPYELKEVNIFEGDDLVEFNKINPLNQLPAFKDGDQLILDSRQIFNYLNLHHKLHNLNWDDENLLYVIEGAMNSGVNLMLMKRSNMDINEDRMFINRQRDRIKSVLDFLKPQLEDRFLKQWDFHSMTLYSFLDWAQFRNLITLDERPECLKFLATHADKSIVKATAIPKV